MVLTVAMPRRRVRRHVLAPLGGDGQEQGSAAAAAFRRRSRCTRRSSTADRERAMLLRCSRADADELANARVTEADASARAAALELELDTAREDSPNPRKPSPSYTPPPTHPARTRTSRGPPTAQDPPARCVTPLALFDTFRSRAYHSYPSGIHTFGHVLQAGRPSFVANKRCASDERRRAWHLAGIASGRWAAGGFAPVREMAECAVRRAPLPLTAVADRHRCWALAAAARGCCGRRARGRREEGRRAPAVLLVVRQAGRAPLAPLVVMKAAAC